MRTRPIGTLAATSLGCGTLIAGALLGLTSSAPAGAANRRAADPAHLAILSSTPARALREAILPCRRGHICGADEHGHSFDYSHCQEYRLPGLVGIGLYNNNQTVGTEAILYEANHFAAFHIKAPNHGRMSWTPIEFIRPC